MRLTLTPVALKNAFATAGANGGTPGSPIPPILSVLFTIWTSISGTSLILRISIILEIQG